MRLFRGLSITKWFGKGERRVKVLSSASFSFPSRGFIGIKGESGSGKSTLLSLLAKFDIPSKGELRFGRLGYSLLSKSRLRAFRGKGIGFVFQHFNLFEDKTLLYNIAFPLLAKGKGKKKAFEQARKVGLKLLDEGRLNSLAANCSGGERQRAGIARALVNVPYCLLCDEPTGALDEMNSSRVMEILSSEAKRRLVIVVSHNESLLNEYCSALFALKNGRLVGESGVEKETLKVELKEERGLSFWWIGDLLGSAKHSLKGLIGVFSSCLIGFCSLLLSLSFFFGQSPAIREARVNCLDASLASVSEEEDVSFDDSLLSLVEQKRPSRQSVESLFSEIEGIRVEEDYSFFFPSSIEFDVLGENITAEASPVYSFSILELGEIGLRGNVPEDDLSYCLINDELAHLFPGEAIGQVIEIACGGQYSGDGWEKGISLSLRMEVAGVVSEFPFLNTPRLYYSYIALDDLLGECAAYYSEKEMVSLGDLALSARPDSYFSSCKYLVFATKRRDLQRFFDKLETFSDEDSPLSFSSRAFLTYDSLASLSGALSTCLYAFLAIEGLLAAGIVFLCCEQRYASERKRCAIAIALGASGLSSLLRMGAPIFAALLSSCLSSLLCAPLLMALGNALAKNYFGIGGLFSFLSLNNYFSFVFPLTLAASLGLGLFCFALLFFRMRSLSLSREMKDE